jgi:hypothetical protein
VTLLQELIHAGPLHGKVTYVGGGCKKSTTR